MKNYIMLFPGLDYNMENSNLVKIFRSFTSKEMKQFREFITSPFYNTNPNVVRLFDLLRKYYPSFKGRSFEREKIFSVIYAGEKYKDSKMRLLIFYLNELAEKFLVNKNLYNNSLGPEVLLLNEMGKRSLWESFEKVIRRAYTKKSEARLKDSDFLINKFHIELHHLNYFSRTPNYNYNATKQESPDEIFMNLTNFYRLIAFEIYEILLTANYLYERSFKLDIFENIIKEFDKDKYSDYPEILCRYYLCMLWNEDQSEQAYLALKDLMAKCSEKISYGSKSAWFVGIQNFCVKNIRRGNNAYLRELFEHHQKWLKSRLYFEDGFMTHTFYRNVVVASVGLKEFEWARKFIEKYKVELQKGIREAIYLYCLAFVETEQLNYEAALKHLSIIRTDEIYLKVGVRILQSRLFFELGWYEQISALVDAARHFLANDKILNSAQKKFYLSFLRYVQRLGLIKNSGSFNKLEALKAEITSENNLHAKDWLLKKIDEISD